MMNLNRRSFLAAASAAALAPTVRSDAGTSARRSRGVRPCAIASTNGLRAVHRAVSLIRDGSDPADAVVAGVKIVEDDPEDMSVGYGGLPNEDGVVQLDASVMHGPTHKAGAVAALERIRNPAAVALKVMRRTDHVLLVGAGALAFAKAHGFKEEDLLTDEARRAWLKWKENLNPDDDWLDDDQRDWDDKLTCADGIPYTYGTINCCAVTEGGDLASVTTTSGLSYKIPGRVGDSPIVGAGMYVDNAVGAAGATGRGEAVIQNCGAFSVVQEMDKGLEPEEACIAVLRKIADRTKQKRLLDEQGRPNFNVTLYALRKDGAYGSACIWGGPEFAICDGDEPRLERCGYLFRGEGR